MSRASLTHLLALLSEQPLSSRQIQHRLGVSQTTASRLLTRAKESIVRLGRGRATRYAATREVFGAALAIPLFRVDERGVVSQIAELRSLASGHYLVQGTGLFWLLGESGTGLYESLPYFLYDLRPSGFVGRQIARRLASEWGFPQDPRDWQDEQIGRYLLRRGHDLPGNLLVGEAAAALASQRRPETVDDRATCYPELARRVLGDELVGSSAAGEQPKFAVCLRAAGQVIVKFSPDADTPDARRWRDLLRAENQALALLAERGIPSARTTLHLLSGRVFLESPRFDRHGALGRSHSLSLSMVDAEYVGLGHGWTRVADGLARRGLLDAQSLTQIAWAEAFGAWIGNTDMHLGNVSLAPTASGFRLLPLYDMLPMAFAPLRGELPKIELRPPIRTALNEQVWADAGQAAAHYWQRLADDSALSTAFRRIAQAHGRRWREVVYE